jgi:hypothetical protein
MYAVVSLMAKIIEVVVSRLRDSAAKACRSSDGRKRPWWRLMVFLVVG